MCERCLELKDYAIFVWHTYDKPHKRQDRLNYTMKWVMKKFPESNRARVYEWVFQNLFRKEYYNDRKCFFEYSYRRG